MMIDQSTCRHPWTAEEEHQVVVVDAVAGEARQAGEGVANAVDMGADVAAADVGGVVLVRLVAGLLEREEGIGDGDQVGGWVVEAVGDRVGTGWPAARRTIHCETGLISAWAYQRLTCSGQRLDTDRRRLCGRWGG
jgi:hypothetical protein